MQRQLERPSQQDFAAQVRSLFTDHGCWGNQGTRIPGQEVPGPSARLVEPALPMGHWLPTEAAYSVNQEGDSCPRSLGLK